MAQEQLATLGEEHNDRGVEAEKDLQRAQEALEEKQAKIEQLREEMVQMESSSKADDAELMALKETVAVGYTLMDLHLYIPSCVFLFLI